MSVHANFFDSESTTKIEINGDAIETSNAYAAALVATIEKLAVLVSDGINNMPQDKRPSDIEIHYALTAMSNGGYAISTGSTNANFEVTLRWANGDGLNITDQLGIPIS